MIEDLDRFLRERITTRRNAALLARREWSGDDASWERYSLAGKLEDAGWYPPPYEFDPHWWLVSPRRTLADLDAMEAIIDLCPDSEFKLQVMRLLAVRYDDHPDYRPEWRPEG